MKFLLSLLLTSTFFSQFCFAQEDYEPAYIVKGQDTIRGLINRQAEQSLSKGIIFKAADGTESSYLPTDIDAFGFTSDEISFEPVNVVLKETGDSINEIRLAKLLVAGPVRLYKLQLAPNELPSIYITDNSYIYLVKKGEDVHVLGRFEKIADNIYRLNKKYIGMSRALFSDCPSMQNFNFDKLDFLDNDIAELVQKYNQCTAPGTASAITKHEVKALIKHGVEVGYSYLSPYKKREITNSSIFSLGYFWDIARPDLSRRNSLRTGITYMYVNYDYYIISRDAFGRKIPGYIKTTNHSIKLPFISQYNIGKLNQKKLPFFSFGMSAVLSSNQNLDFIDFLYFVNIAAGVYINKLKVNFLLENRSFSVKADRILGIGIAWRFDKKYKID